MSPAMTEEQLAERVVAYLESCGHDVYQEVECVSGVADIVALVGPGRELWIVECKTSWSWALLEQCLDRKRSAARVFAAAPAPYRHGRVFADLGIGAILVDSERVMHHGDLPARVSADPRHGQALRRKLREGHKTHAKAGSQGGGGRYTPFVATCDELRKVVRATPGITLKAAVEETRHHYSSHATARASLAKWIEKGIVPGVRADVADGLRLFPTEAK